MPLVQFNQIAWSYDKFIPMGQTFFYFLRCIQRDCFCTFHMNYFPPKSAQLNTWQLPACFSFYLSCVQNERNFKVYRFLESERPFLSNEKEIFQIGPIDHIGPNLCQIGWSYQKIVGGKKCSVFNVLFKAIFFKFLDNIFWPEIANFE